MSAEGWTGFGADQARRVVEATKAREAAVRNDPAERARSPRLADSPECLEVYTSQERTGTLLRLHWINLCTGATGYDDVEFCCQCNPCFHVTTCCGIDAEGATVTILDGETEVTSGTTDADGNVCFELGSGTFTYSVAFGCFTPQTGSIDCSDTDPIEVNMEAGETEDCECACCCEEPVTSDFLIFVTDPKRTVTLNRIPGTAYWQGCFSATVKTIKRGPCDPEELCKEWEVKSVIMMYRLNVCNGDGWVYWKLNESCPNVTAADSGVCSDLEGIALGANPLNSHSFNLSGTTCPLDSLSKSGSLGPACVVKVAFDDGCNPSSSTTGFWISPWLEDQSPYPTCPGSPIPLSASA